MIDLPALNFFKKKTSPTHFVALDIGSDFCKVLICRRPNGEDGRLEILGVGSSPQGLTDTTLGVPADIKALTKDIEVALNEASLSCDVEPREVVLGLSGEMVAALTTRVRMTREKPDKAISERELARIEKKIRDAAFIEAAEEMTLRKGREGVEIRIVNSEITQVEVDGFAATEPVGFKGEKLELSYFTAFAPRNHLDVLELIVRSLNLRPLAVASGMFALLKALTADREASEFDAVLIDIGGEVTDIGVVFGGNIVSSRTLPVGGRAFTRVLARERGLDFPEAESLKLRFSQGDCAPEESAEIKDILSETREFWGLGVKEALAEMKEIEVFPQRVFLCGGGAQLPGLSELLSSPEWVRELSFSGSTKVRTLSPSDFKFFEDRTGKLNAPDWVAPVALGYFGWKLPG